MWIIITNQVKYRQKISNSLVGLSSKMRSWKGLLQALRCRCQPGEWERQSCLFWLAGGWTLTAEGVAGTTWPSLLVPMKPLYPLTLRNMLNLWSVMYTTGPTRLCILSHIWLFVGTESWSFLTLSSISDLSSVAKSDRNQHEALCTFLRATLLFSRNTNMLECRWSPEPYFGKHGLCSMTPSANL